MSNPTSASRPETLVDAKAQFVRAAYAASPVRLIERRPLLSVTAVASTALAATVLIGDPLVRNVGGGLATHGLGIVNSLLKSQFAGSLLGRFIPQPNAATAPPSTPTTA